MKNNRQGNLWLGLGLALAMIVCLASVSPAESVTFDFEQPEPIREQWRQTNWAGQGAFSISDQGRGTGRCLEIQAREGVDSAWHARVPVKAFSTYRLTGWIRTRGVETESGRGALLNLHSREGATRALKGTTDWTKVEMTFETMAEGSVQINCLLGGWGSATGTAWYDDIVLECLSTTPPGPNEAVVDLSTTGEPISKYIYGQFIEHLGRCIYGGIWAEMLEDRKFIFPITTDYKPYRNMNREKQPGEIFFDILVASPWRIVGTGAVVSMVEENDWTRQAVPQVTVKADAAGIEQLDLALIEGKEYVGRVVLAAVEGSGPVEARLIWGDGADERSVVSIPRLSKEFTKYPLQFKAGASTENGRLQIIGSGKGTFQIAAVSLMPADNVEGFRPDVLALLKELDSPIYRWPGGNFVSGYEWRDGIGDPDKRPTRRNPAWTGIEPNDVGIHEFVKFCRLINTEPMIAVNTGFGDAWSAMEEVEYSNGGVDTAMGQWRAENGDAEPFDIEWWCVGNEMFGSWQLGYMSLNHYTIKHNLFAERMWSVDPDLKLVGVGEAGNWSRGMLERCADNMDLLSEHFYVQEDRNSLVGHVNLPVRQIRRIADAHREYRKTIPQLEGKDIRVAMDEWNYWYGPHVYGELGTRYFLKDALGIAAGLHEFYRNSDIYYMANYAQTVNVIGAIKTTKTDAAFATTGQILAMYRKQYGAHPLTVENKGRVLDVAAAWTEDRKTLTLSVVNPLEEAQELKLGFSGGKAPTAGTVHRLSGPEPGAYNEPGKDLVVTIHEEAFTLTGDTLELPPLSASIYRFNVK